MYINSIYQLFVKLYLEPDEEFVLEEDKDSQNKQSLYECGKNILA